MGKRNLWYFGLEPLKARYTYQLSNQWMPATFAEYADELDFIAVQGNFDPNAQIKVGAVLDAVGRSKFSLSQCSNFIEAINQGLVQDGDIIYLQDYWTPGIEAIFYTLDLYGINVKVYAMLHAQSVDEYDFTYDMAYWMRGYELGLDARMTGIFVGSTIHKEQLRAAGFKSKIHVVSLPIHSELCKAVLPNWGSIAKENIVVFSSRLDKEKNPFFMMEVAEQFLELNPSYEWHFTTSGKDLKSMLPGVVDAMYALATKQPRFKILTNLTKEEYYTELCKAKIQFNCSLQDYVSWTVIESTLFGCDICFPDFRSFPEFIPADRMYQPFDIASAINKLNKLVEGENKFYYHGRINQISDLGRQMEGYIIANDFTTEINVWHEAEYCEFLLKNK